MTLASQGYPSCFWVTFNQANKLGGTIRKGEHSSPVIYWNIGEEREYTTRDGETRVSKPFLLRYSSVFNLSQTEGIDLPASALQETRTNNPIEDCERIVAEMPNSPRSSNPTRHGTRLAATLLECHPLACFVPVKNITRRFSRISPFLGKQKQTRPRGFRVCPVVRL